MARSIEPYKDMRLPERFLRWIETLRFRIQTIPCYTQNAGSPEGVVDGQQGDRYYDETNDVLYIKSTDVGNTGWLAVGAVGPGGTPSRRNILGSGPLQSDLFATSINFTAAGWDLKNVRGLVGGGSAFCGSMADLKSGKVAEFATLPSTVITNADVGDIAYNGVDNGVLVRLGNQHARAPAAGTPWTAITPPPFVSYRGFMSWQDTQLVAFHDSVSGGDYVVSSDNGVSWSASISNGKIGTSTGASKNANESKLMHFGGNNNIAWTSSADLTAAVWNAFALNTLISTAGNTSDFDWNLDGSKGIGVTSMGDDNTTIDGGLTWVRFNRDLNLFRNGTVNSHAIDYCVFVSDLNGWMMGSGSRGAFISNIGNLDTMTMVNYAMITVFLMSDGARATDGTDLLLPASQNLAGMLLQQS